ncbi:glycoside hydrolase family 32 protein [Ammoniphilus sp. 3BR4]|uniref:glycoside hydrolase family 32 protein n=1 Tax=Ammoniphilus sp. 3BR4 TaxID=3158265 RepID=UPI003464F087
MEKHQSLINTAQESNDQIKETVSDNHWRLQYHIAAPAYWINDPNGFCYNNGEYHLFYQHHPYSPQWGPMHWGHVKSKDLAFWEHLPIALAPSEEYDRDGCFSGSAIEKDGKLYLMYTGNVWTGDNHDTDLKQCQCLAVSEDGIAFTKLNENPVIAAAPEGDIHPYHFRDPKVWKNENQYYAVLGSKTMDNRGQVLLYRSDDLIHWEFVNVMAKGEGNFGYMWECPDFFHLDGRDVLVMSPQGMKPEGNLYQNLHQSGYVLGQLNYETGTFPHQEFRMLDDGFDFYAPQTTIDAQGRRILIAWMDMWESKMPTQEYQWAGAMTLPRVLTLRDDKLLCSPVPELEKLREEEVSYRDLTIQGVQSLAEIAGDSLELQLEVDAKDAAVFGLKLRVDERAQQETVLTYSKKEKVLILDRNQSGAGPGGIRKAAVDLIHDRLKLQIFIDQSSIEIFINEGEKVMTARVYPRKEAVNIHFFSDGPLEIVQLKKWKMKKSIA